MELGDRVYAAERITKKREKRVSIASSRLQMAIPSGIVRAPLPPLHLSLLPPRTSCLFFFSSFSLALTAGFARGCRFFYDAYGSRYRTLCADRYRYRRSSPVTWYTMPFTSSNRENTFEHRSSPIHRFYHRRDYRFAPVNETAIPRPVTLRHVDRKNNNGVSFSKRSPLFQTVK